MSSACKHGQLAQNGGGLEIVPGDPHSVFDQETIVAETMSLRVHAACSSVHLRFACDAQWRAQNDAVYTMRSAVYSG